MKLSDYINWFNYHRLHGSLDYLSTVDYRFSTPYKNRLKRVAKPFI